MYVQLYKLDYIAALPLEAGISDAITIVLPVVTGEAALPQSCSWHKSW